MSSTNNNNFDTGSELINLLAQTLQIPIQTCLTAQIIYAKMYPIPITMETKDLAYVCIFLASKIEETYIKLEYLIAAMYKITKINSCKQNIVKIENYIVQKLNYNFSPLHIHTYIGKICNTLEFSDISLFNKADKLYNCQQINLVSIIEESKFHPFMVALSLFENEQIKKLEEKMYIEFDIKIITQIRDELFS
ncbi:hypothetical protein COBT_000742 [Conglomerata obtusa]